MEIFITGYGIISAIGNGVDETLNSLLDSSSGVGPIRHLLTDHAHLPTGEVKFSNSELATLAGVDYPESELRTVLLGIIAGKEAIASAGLQKVDIEHAAFINGTTVGGMDLSEKHFAKLLQDSSDEIAMAELGYNDCGVSSRLIADRLGKFGFITTSSTACSSAANAIILGANMISNGLVDIVVAGGSESLSKFHLNGFNTLMILDKERSRPFDELRAGINLGEGAAYIVMESKRSALRRGVTPLGILRGYANTCDAFHQTASSDNGEGAYLSMTEAMEMAGIKPAEIDYINAHGTGTPNNDITELAAMKRIWGQDLPHFSSTKPFTGHTTSASGSIEAVISLLALRHGFIPANAGWVSPIAPDSMPVTSMIRNNGLRNIICNSFGFGGNDSTLIFSNPDYRFSCTEDGAENPVYRTPHKDCNTSKSETEGTPYPCYIQSVAQVSCQSPLCDDWMEKPALYSDKFAPAIEPSVKEFVKPSEARRLSRILKRTVATSLTALKEADLDMPDAIITGTGMGCLENSEKFLTDMAAYGESKLKPTLFMQSTHNTISSLIAIMLKCHGYNNTYSHRGISFDSALLDAMIQINRGKIMSALVGAHDEVTPLFADVLAHTHPEFNLISENSVSAVISGKADKAICKLADIKILNRPVLTEVASILKNWMSDPSHCAIITGMNDNPLNDTPYKNLLDLVNFKTRVLKYRHIFGDNYSSSAMGFYVGVRILENSVIPAHLVAGSEEIANDIPGANGMLRDVIILNHTEYDIWSIIKLTSTRNL